MSNNSNNRNNKGSLLNKFKQGIKQFGELFKDNDSRERGDTTPCPGANGTSIGSFQQFNLLCGRNLGGDIIDESQQANFLACIDRCATFHPRCDSVSFDGQDCRLKTGSGTAGSRSSKRFDSALGIFGTIPSDSGCNALGASTTLGSTKFDISCGFVINGNDLFQEHRTNFNDCLTLCSQTPSCAAISFDVDMDQGFQNCYLKRGNTGEGLVRMAGMDSAVVNNNAPAPSLTTTSSTSTSTSSSTSTIFSTLTSSTSSTSSSPSTSSSSSAPDVTSVAQSSAATTLIPPVPGTTSSTAAVSLSTTSAVTAVTSTVVTSLITQTSVSEGRTTLLTSLLTTTRALTPPPASATPSMYENKVVDGISSPAQQSNSATPAVIAGSVVGSIAAVVLILIAVLFVLRRKRRNQEAVDDSEAAETSAGSSAGISAWFRGRLPQRSYNDKNQVDENAAGGVAAFFGNLRRLAGSGGDDRGSRAHDEKMRATEQGIGRDESSQKDLRHEENGDDASLRPEDNDYEASLRDGHYGDVGPMPPMPTYEGRRSRFFELRDSMNGLAQHKPDFVRT